MSFSRRGARGWILEARTAAAVAPGAGHRLAVPFLIGLALALQAPVALASESPSSPTASTREVYIPLALGSRLDPGKAFELSAFLEERPQQVLRVDSENPRWQVLVYFAAPVSTPDGLRRTARHLARIANRLAELGPTEIVLADPLPCLYLDRSRDPLAIREALSDLAREAMTTGELQWHRQRYLEQNEDGGATLRATEALAEELELLERQRLALGQWLAARRSVGPRLLILVENGYDLNPRSFFGEQTGGAFLEDPRARKRHSQWARELASEGWTVLGAALGPRPAEFNDPLAPLHQLTEATGGRLVTSRSELTRSLEQIAQWPVAVIRLEGSSDDPPGSLVVRDRETGRQLRTAQWAALSRPGSMWIARDDLHPTSEQRPALRLLRPQGPTAVGETRFRTVSGRRRIDRVIFLLDGLRIAEDDKAPFAAVIDLGPTARPRTVSAVAFSKTGRKIGEDTLQLNLSLAPPEVSIQRMEFDVEAARLTVTASASEPHGESPVTVDFYLNHDLVDTLRSPPYTLQIPVSELAPSDYVRVVALYPNGMVAEAAKIPAASGSSDELEVNLVELLAMVRTRSRDKRVELERSDFVIRRQGRPTQIAHFARWDDLSLTLGLVLDSSDSMQEILADTREAAERFFRQALRDGDEAFVVDFNTLPRLASEKTADADQLMHTLESFQASGTTALYDAIVFSLLQFEKSTGRRALVVLTDGEDSASRYHPRDCVEQARLHGVPVYLIVLGTPPDPNREPNFLRNQAIATRTGGQVYYVSDLDDLTRIYEQIGEELRRQYFLSFSSDRSLSPEELREIAVEVTRKGVTVQTLLASQQRGG